jgi:hypothetical protein
VGASRPRFGELGADSDLRLRDRDHPGRRLLRSVGDRVDVRGPHHGGRSDVFTGCHHVRHEGEAVPGGHVPGPSAAQHGPASAARLQAAAVAAQSLPVRGALRDRERVDGADRRGGDRLSGSGCVVRQLAVILLPLLAMLAVLVLVVEQLPPSLHVYWRALFPDWHAGVGSALRTLETVTRGVFQGLSSLPPALGALCFVGAVGVLLTARDWWIAAQLVGPLALGFALVASGAAPMGGGRIDMWLYPALAMTIGMAAEHAVRYLQALCLGSAVVGGAIAVLAALAFTQRQLYYPSTNIRQQLAYIAEHRARGDQVDVATSAVYEYAYLTSDKLRFRVDKSDLPGFAVSVIGTTELLDAPGGRGATTPPTCTNALRIWWVSVGPDPAERRLRACGYRLDATPVPHLDLWWRVTGSAFARADLRPSPRSLALRRDPHVSERSHHPA